MVPFVSVHNMMRLIHEIGINEMIIGLAAYIEEDFNRWPLFDKTTRVAAYARDGVISLCRHRMGSNMDLNMLMVIRPIWLEACKP